MTTPEPQPRVPLASKIVLVIVLVIMAAIVVPVAVWCIHALWMWGFSWTR